MDTYRFETPDGCFEFESENDITAQEAVNTYYKGYVINTYPNVDFNGLKLFRFPKDWVQKGGKLIEVPRVIRQKIKDFPFKKGDRVKVKDDPKLLFPNSTGTIDLIGYFVDSDNPNELLITIFRDGGGVCEPYRKENLVSLDKGSN